MLSDRCLSVCLSVCLSCPVCLCVTLVYCGQTVGWIKMKLGTQVGLGPSHIVFDGEPAPPRKERGTAAPTFELTGAGFAYVRIIRSPRLLWPNG